MPSLRARLLLLLSSALLSACTSLSFGIVNLPSYFARSTRIANVAFGPAPWQRLDVYQPPAQAGAAPRPVITFWHGGGWTMGSKDQYRFVGMALARLGYLVVLPDYRQYPQVRFPAFVDDAASSVAWVQAHVSEYGGDPKHLVLMGHSAGAHMAAMLAIDHDYLLRNGADPRAIIGLIGLSGPYVLAPNTPVLHAIFGPPYTPHDWQVLPYVTEQAPPALLIHGGADMLVSPSQSEDLGAALRAHGVAAQVRIYPRRGHAATVAGLAWLLRFHSPTLKDVDQFLRTLH